VGFELPSLSRAADPDDGEPIVALFDVTPSAQWSALFAHDVREISERSGLTKVSVHRDRILLFGAVADARKLCDDIRGLVDRVSLRERDERLGDGGAESGDLGETSFRRND
jgi:hypothetical protein